MGMFDSMMRDGGVPTLMASLGEAEGVKVLAAAGWKPFTASVGRLEPERIDTDTGSLSRSSIREVCQVSVACPMGTIGVNTKLLIARYTTGDSSVQEGQTFRVESIMSQRESLTVARCWREMLSSQRAQGSS